jgi:restriction system protein
MKLFRGWIGEKKTALNMWLSLNTNIYRRFHNIIIPSKSGTSQIDHLLVSPYGLFIVETKNKQGWIYGSENQAKWTQTFYQKKYTFQNPLRQTFRQKKVLSEFLKMDESLIHTVVYFVGDCTFKTPLPANVLTSNLGRYIKSFQDPILTQNEIDRVLKILEQHISESSLTKRDHVQSLNERHSSDTVCPWCGSRLVERTVKKGSNAGSKFLGCEGYPKCRFTKNV